MGAAALSDDKVATAAQRLIPIYVDCTKRGDHGDLLTKYKVQGYPAIIYTDAEGVPVREMNGRDPGDLIKDIDAAVAKVPPRPSIWQPSVAAARDLGKKSKKLVAVYFVDPKADLAKLNARLMKDLGDRKTKFVWVLESGQDALLKKYELESAPAVVVIDPKSEEALAKIPVKEDDKAEVLNKALDDAAKLLKK